MAWLQKVYQHQPRLFAHWQLIAFTSGWAVGAGSRETVTSGPESDGG